MAQQYIVQLRRGWKEDDRDDWARYESEPDHIKPLAGELVLEYDHGVPRLKIGDGTHEFSDLPYMSIDSFVLPTQASIYLDPDKWEQAVDEQGNLIEDRYYQAVEVKNAIITENSKVDLQPNPEDLVVFHEKDIAFTAVNAGGNVRVCVIGQKPVNAYTIQATVTEVAGDA